MLEFLITSECARFLIRLKEDSKRALFHLVAKCLLKSGRGKYRKDAEKEGTKRHRKVLC